MYLALYRAWRPETFGEILGQEHIVKILKNQIKEDTVSHAYLFCGSRGTGKTTTARILAKGVNCTSEGEQPCGVCESCVSIKEGRHIDVIEIDAASNNGVDNIRELRESVKYPPAVGRKKVYIIDEVHMLSAGASNALLKTLEEPPEHVVFVLATTEPHKLPATILSRCMRLDFRRVSETLIKERMGKICREKGIDVSDSALGLIAMNADGSVRDGLSILDQCIAAGDLKVTRDDVLELIGASGEEVYLDMADLIKNGDGGKALLLLDSIMEAGKDARQFLKDLLAHYRNLLIVKFVNQPADMLNVSYENAERIKEQSEGIPLADVNRAILEISKTAAEAKWSTQPRILAELCVVLLAEGIEAPAPAPRKTAPAPAPRKTAPAPAPAQQKATAAEPVPRKEDEIAEPQGEETPEASGKRLWDSLFEGEDGLRGSFTIIRKAEIKAMSESEYIVVARSEAVKDIIDKHKRAIEELLERRTGKNRIIKCVIEDEKSSGSEEKRIEDVAAEIENALGLRVEIVK
ncbi:MAG: DNA polymerase III subunit gamma/tau [Clostridiales bacterium]|nr:DNA polymerase III subunit gamma/tau [Clostridiales bacterium]